MKTIKIRADKVWNQKEQEESLFLSFDIYRDGEWTTTKEVRWTLRQAHSQEQMNEMLDRIRALISG